MNSKNVTTIKQIISGLILLFGLFGLGQYVGVLEFLSDNAETGYTAIINLIEVIGGAYGLFKGARQSTVGEIIENKYNTRTENEGVRPLKVAFDDVYEYAKSI